MTKSTPILKTASPAARDIASLSAVHMAGEPWVELSPEKQKTLLDITQATLDFLQLPIVDTLEDLENLPTGTVLIELVGGTEFTVSEKQIHDTHEQVSLNVHSDAGRNYLPALIKSMPSEPKIVTDLRHLKGGTKYTLVYPDGSRVMAMCEIASDNEKDFSNRELGFTLWASESNINDSNITILEGHHPHSHTVNTDEPAPEQVPGLKRRYHIVVRNGAYPDVPLNANNDEEAIEKFKEQYRYPNDRLIAYWEQDSHEDITPILEGDSII